LNRHLQMLAKFVQQKAVTKILNYQDYMTIGEFNKLQKNQQEALLFTCCGSDNWVSKMLEIFPVRHLEDLQQQAILKWQQCGEKDYLQAFSHHPKIGDIKILKEKFVATANLASVEQSGVNEASEDTLQALAKENIAYEEKFGFIFIVCASGKSAEEMLTILQSRLSNDLNKELKIAAAEQIKITLLRLKKLFE